MCVCVCVDVAASVVVCGVHVTPRLCPSSGSGRDFRRTIKTVYQNKSVTLAQLHATLYPGMAAAAASFGEGVDMTPVRERCVTWAVQWGVTG